MNFLRENANFRPTARASRGLHNISRVAGRHYSKGFTMCQPTAVVTICHSPFFSEPSLLLNYHEKGHRTNGGTKGGRKCKFGHFNSAHSFFLPSLVRSWAIFLVRRGERAKVAQLASVRPRGRGEREDAVDGSLGKLSTKLGRCLLFSKSSNGQFGR